MNPFAIVCSGQGAQTLDLFEAFPFGAKGRGMKEQILASGSLPPEVAAWLAQPQAQPTLIYQDHYAQPLLCLFQAMVWAELADRLPTPQLVAGYSLGELSAYGCAGALAPEDVVGLASIRAQVMDAAAPEGKLIAVTGLAVERAAALAREHGGHVAIIVGGDHCILGCLAENANVIVAALQTEARSVVPLHVSIASHTPLLEAAVAPFREALLARKCGPFHMPVLAGVNATPIVTQTEMVRWLPEQIHRTVRWDMVMSRLEEAYCRVILELGTGNQLAHMALAEAFKPEARSVTEFRTVDGIVSWVEKSLERAN